MTPGKVVDWRVHVRKNLTSFLHMGCCMNNAWTTLLSWLNNIVDDDVHADQLNVVHADRLNVVQVVGH